MYKDKEKQKEANRQAAARRRAKGMQGMTNSGMTQGMQAKVIPKSNTLHPDIIANIKRISKDEAEVKVRMAAALKYAQLFTNRPAYSEFAKRMAQAGPGHVQVSKPGDDDFVCSKTEPKICWRCGKPTSSPLLDTHYNCTIERRTQTVNTVVGNDVSKEGEGLDICPEPHTAPVVDEQ